MNAFLESLYSDSRNEKVPQDRDIFGALIGTWDILWIDHLDSVKMRVLRENGYFHGYLMVPQFKTHLSFPPGMKERYTPSPMRNMVQQSEFTILKPDYGIYFTGVWVGHSGLPVKNTDMKLSSPKIPAMLCDTYFPILLNRHLSGEKKYSPMKKIGKLLLK